jgi:hypothetical protein
LRYKILFTLLLLSISFALSSCGSSSEITRDETPSPCNDKLYLALQKKDTSTFSEFEKIYFLRKQKECREGYIKIADKKEHDKKQKVGEDIVKIVMIAGAVVGALLLIVVANGWKQ